MFLKPQVSLSKKWLLSGGGGGICDIPEGELYMEMGRQTDRAGSKKLVEKLLNSLSNHLCLFPFQVSFHFSLLDPPFPQNF